MRELLNMAVPHAAGEVPSIIQIAMALSVSRQSIHNWLRDGFIPADRAFRLLNKAKGAITLEMIAPYITEMDG